MPFAWVRERYDYINAISAFDRVGLNLFESKRQNKKMLIFSWAVFMPVASGQDTLHWDPKYNELYLGLLYTKVQPHDNATV